MKQAFTKARLKFFGRTVALTVMTGMVIGVIGYMKKWDTSLAYSNTLFIVGCLMIVAGVASQLGASRQRNYHQQVNAERSGEMSSSERENIIVKESSAESLAVLVLLSGFLLLLISWIVLKLF